MRTELTTMPAFTLTMDEIEAARTVVHHYVNYDPCYPRASREELAKAFRVMAAWFAWEGEEDQ